MEDLERFHKTRRGYLVFGFLELALMYLFASIAIDTGSLFAYAAAIILGIGSVLNLTKAILYNPTQSTKRSQTKAAAAVSRGTTQTNRRKTAAKRSSTSKKTSTKQKKGKRGQAAR